MESLEIISRTTRSKKLEVKGGFYSKEDMKTELGYSQTLSSSSLFRSGLGFRVASPGWPHTSAHHPSRPGPASTKSSPGQRRSAWSGHYVSSICMCPLMHYEALQSCCPGQHRLEVCVLNSSDSSQCSHVYIYSR